MNQKQTYVYCLMPELPEVETVRKGITPHIIDKIINDVIIRERRLRWPVTHGLKKKLSGKKIIRITRRGKYLLLTVTDGEHDPGTLLIHLGMSGRLRLVPTLLAPEKHDHIDVILAGGQALRFTDPRRFGAVLWVEGDPLQHKLLVKLGPEPLENFFNTQYLLKTASYKKAPVKSFVMDSHVVVGVGHIYENEALFLAGIHPMRQAGSLTVQDCAGLVKGIKKVLKAAIKAGGTTLRDFVSADGRSGYFQQELSVYGRGGLPCTSCATTLTESRVGQRSTVYCESCQT